MLCIRVCYSCRRIRWLPSGYRAAAGFILADNGFYASKFFWDICIGLLFRCVLSLFFSF
jgi:hypothetical protein